MSKLTEQSLDFAKAHIDAFWDSDFFPKPDVYEALWARWTDVRQYLRTKNLEHFARPSTRVMPAPKANGGFRIVHQLDPLSAIAYTAIAHEIARAVESARVPITERVVFSYRLDPDTDSFFTKGSGYPDFVDCCRELAEQYKHVLVCDLADFYNRVYIHRVRNNIEGCGLKDIAKSLETFLLNLNMKASQGIPVGPAASIVVAEAALVDVDQFLRDRDMRYVRYVDDIRIFADEPGALHRLLEDLVSYLYEPHRLQLAWSKTHVVEASDFIARYLDPPHKVERRELLGVAREVTEYGHTYTDNDADALVNQFIAADKDIPIVAAPKALKELKDILAYWLSSEEQERREVRRTALAKILKLATSSRPIDLGLARYVLKKGRALGVPDLFEVVLETFEALAPAAPDLFLYLQKVGTAELVTKSISALKELRNTSVVQRSRFLRHWLQWYYASNETLLGDRVIRRYLTDTSPIELQARAAFTTKNVAWVRARKGELAQMGSWDRWATILAARIMSKDERRAWLQSVVGGDSDAIDRIVVEWVVGLP